MNKGIEERWNEVLHTEFEKDYFKTLITFVDHDYRATTCYPEEGQIFAAFEHCAFDNLKVVIVGQDPYHGLGQANGLCFSVHEGIAHPPSLINIFKELQTDLDIPYPESGDLSSWAKQGVLLLNATLTVREHQAGSHQSKGWEQFTDEVIRTISAHKEDVVFLLWGGFAKKKVKLIDTTKHHILTSGHPSPLSANRGYWFGNKHFSKTNAFLQSKAMKAINWKL